MVRFSGCLYRYVEDVPEFHLLDAAMLTRQVIDGIRCDLGGVEVRADQLLDPLLTLVHLWLELACAPTWNGRVIFVHPD